MAFIDLDREAPEPQYTGPTSRQRLWLGVAGVAAVSLGVLVGGQLSPTTSPELHGISQVERGKVAILTSVRAAIAHAAAAEALAALNSVTEGHQD